jgi:hypothetical protein
MAGKVANKLHVSKFSSLEYNEKSCEYSAIQYVAKSISTCKKKSLYNQPKPYFFIKIIVKSFLITATMNKLRHRVYKCNDVLFTFFYSD